MENSAALKTPDQRHKVVIYFGDSTAKITETSCTNIDQKLCAKPKVPPKPARKNCSSSSDTAIESGEVSNSNDELMSETEAHARRLLEETAMLYLKRKERSSILPEDHIYQEVDDGVIDVNFEDNYECASRLVADIERGEIGEDTRDCAYGDDYEYERLDYYSDWSFVQEWRAR